MNLALLANSLTVAVAASCLAVVFGAAGAVWLSALGASGRKLALLGAAASLSLPPFVVTNCWLDLLGQASPLRQWIPLNIYSLPGTVWVLALLLWPIALFFVSGDLQKLDATLVESEPGLRGTALIRNLLFPLVQPSLIRSGILTFILALNNFAVPAILQTKVYPAEMWVSFNTTFDFGAALKTGWPLLILPLLLIIGLRSQPIPWPRLRMGLSSELFRTHLGKGWFALCGGLFTLVLLLSLAAPLVQLMGSKRTWLELPGALAASKAAVWNSFWSSVAGATFCSILGLGLWKWRTGMILWPVLLLPGVALGMGLIFLLNRPWLFPLYQSFAVIIVAFALRYSALAWAGARRAMQSVDARLTEFAKLNGAGWRQLYPSVYWPQTGRMIGAVWCVVYLLCLWDVETLVLIIPPGGENLALRIFNLLHYGHATQVNALSVLLLGLGLLPLAGWILGDWLRNAARSGLRRISLAGPGVCSVLLASGCIPSSPQNEAPVQSKFFSSVRIIGSRGTALGQFNKPRSLTLDARDNLFVVDMTGRVQKFSSDGVYLSSWQMPEIEKGRPKGMCIDSDGNIVVVEPHYSRVNHFSPSGELIAQWGMHGTNDGQLTLPRAAVTTPKGDLVVCEYTLVDRVQEFSRHGEHWKFSFGHSGLAEGEFNRPEGLAVDKQGNIYVADSCNHRIQIFSADGKFLRTYGKAGSGLGELSYPYDIRLDKEGRQYVCEFGNSRIQIFDAQDRPLEILGKAGADPGQFSNPWGIAFDSAENLYVVDAQNHRVQKFTRKENLAHTASPSGFAGDEQRIASISLARTKPLPAELP